MKTSCAAGTGWTVALATVLVLLLLGHCFGEEGTNPPPGEPPQILSQVNYDPNLSNPFFDTDKWTCPHDAKECEEKDRLKETARCLTTFQGDRFIRFCDAKLLDCGRIELFIHDSSPSSFDHLTIVVENGVFWSQYSSGGDEKHELTTKRQKLTLNKKVYRKGDLIKGKIDLECLLVRQKCSTNTEVYGVFKTIIK